MFKIHAGLVANGSILFSRHLGVQTGPEMEREIAKVLATFDDHAVLPQIVDLSHLRGSELDFKSSRPLARSVLRHVRTRPKTPKRVGIFAPNETFYGLTRIYSTLLELADENVEAMGFRTETETLAFLERPETRLSQLEGFDKVGPLPPPDFASVPL